MVDNQRDMRLLDGRRVQVKDLLDRGLLKVDAVLEFRRPRSGERYLAEVTPAGRLRLEDGREFAAPSRAAMEAAEIGAIDGWSAWAVSGSDRTLFSLRKALLDEAAQAIHLDGNNEHAAAAESRREWLTAARAAADAGTPVRVAVRELLKLWDAEGRAHRIVDRVSADLENYSLDTRPDFRKVSVDSVVEIVSQPSGADDLPEVPGPPTNAAELEVGLTLGNVPSALGGIASVKPQDSLAKAMTVMRLNDFSQLAVMPTSRILDGAVTWRSIAKALAHDPHCKLADATEPAREHPFDRDLVDVLIELFDRDFVFVRNSTNEISGIVTAADVVLLYGKTATPFFIIGEIDHSLRAFISDAWTVEQVASICDPDGLRGIGTHDDLTFGDYQRMLEGPERFASLGWPLDRVTFINRLNDVREIRNGVAHFDPDPLEADVVSALRNFLNLLRDLRSQASR